MVLKKMETMASFLAFVMISILISCGKRADQENTIFVAQDISSVSTLDPAESYNSATTEILANAYRRLFRGCNNKIVNDLAESYKFLQNGRVLRIKLRKNIVFASGNPVTADDVIFSITRLICLGKTPAEIIDPLGYTPENVHNNIRYFDDHTVDFEFPKKVSQSVVLACLSSLGVSIVDSITVKRHSVGGDYGNGWLRTAYAGGGAFVIASWKPGESVTLKKNTKYERPISIDGVVFRHVDDVATRSLLLQRGEVDIATGLPAEYVEQLGQKGYKLLRRNQGIVWFLNMNQKNPYLRNPKIQQAIRHLINYKEIAQVFGAGIADPLPTLIPRGFDGYTSEFSVPEFDPCKAKRLVHEAFGKDIELEMDVYHLAVGQAMQSVFAKGGIRLKLNYCDNKQAIARLRSRTHTMSLKHMGPDLLDSLTYITVFVSNPGVVAWRNHIDNSDIEGLVERLTSCSKEEKPQLYKEIQRRFLQKPLVVLAQDYGTVVFSKDVKNIGHSSEIFGLHFEYMQKEKSA